MRDIFLNHNVNTDYKIKWNKPDKEGLVEFLCYEHGFSENRVVKASDKLKELYNTEEDFLTRDYTIINNGEILMWIKEFFPINYFTEI